MNQPKNEIDTTIDKARKAIRENDVKEAVRLDGLLHEYLKTGLDRIAKQSEIHKNQYDVITKYRWTNWTIEWFYFLATMASATLAVTSDTGFQFLYWAVAALSGYRLIIHGLGNVKPMQLFKFQERAICAEKEFHERMMVTLSKITQFQMESMPQMSKIYEEYNDMSSEKSIYDILGLKNPEEEKNDDDDQS